MLDICLTLIDEPSDKEFLWFIMYFNIERK